MHTRGQERSVSEDRGHEERRRLCHSPHSMPGSRISRRERLSRSTAQDIPDIYWEQAARELDFCTCRKCQARYRQYFENEDPVSPVSTDSMGEAIIPMETQVIRGSMTIVCKLDFIFKVLMQEIFTDGMAFCSLM